MDVCGAPTHNVDAGTEAAIQQLQLKGVLSLGYGSYAPPHALSKRYSWRACGSAIQRIK
jgi:hypothetical protein